MLGVYLGFISTETGPNWRNATKHKNPGSLTAQHFAGIHGNWRNKTIIIQNKTVLIIAHKLRTVAGCDKIVVLDSGSVAEEGNHETLMEQKGLYHKLYTLQSESLVWKVRA